MADLRRGDLVAFPTETVYGLGADATNARAVAAVFEAKGRPSFNPLISHVASLEAAAELGEMTEPATRLARAFWPGPLTLVLPKRTGCPVAELATAGLDTVAVRVPAHSVARALLKHRNLMVITNNLNVANILATSPNVEVIVAGGILRRADGALVGDVTAEFIGQFKVDYAIIGSAAVDPDGSLLDYDFREVRVAQAIVKNARKSYLVADHTKFKMAAPVRIASLADLDGFFTDIAPPKSILQLCADNDVFIRTVEHGARGR